MDFLKIRKDLNLDRTEFVRKLKPFLFGIGLDEFLLERLENGEPLSIDRKDVVEKAVRSAFPEEKMNANNTRPLDDINFYRNGKFNSLVSEAESKDMEIRSCTGENKRAVLVGINKYEDLPPLKYARKDAEDVAQALCSYAGFRERDIDVLTCTDLPGSRATFLNVRSKLLEVRAEEELDFFFFGYWGHGTLGRDKNLYLTSVDTSRADVMRTSMPIDLLALSASQLRSKGSLMVLDCCQEVLSGSRSIELHLDNNAQAAIRNTAQAIASTAEKSHEYGLDATSAILTSCRPGEFAYESQELCNGHFTYHLKSAIEAGVTRVTDIASTVAKETALSVMKEKGQRQSPWLELKGTGDLHL